MEILAYSTSMVRNVDRHPWPLVGQAASWCMCVSRTVTVSSLSLSVLCTQWNLSIAETLLITRSFLIERKYRHIRDTCAPHQDNGTMHIVAQLSFNLSLCSTHNAACTIMHVKMEVERFYCAV